MSMLDEILEHKHRELAAAKACLGLVPQEINLNLFDTVLNVVINQAGYYGIGRKLAMQRAEQYLGELKLWDRRFDQARSLSGGLKRRLMIARALIHQPKLLRYRQPGLVLRLGIQKVYRLSLLQA